MPPQIEKPQPQPKSVSFHGGGVNVNAIADGADKSPSSSSSSSSIHLRWSRIKKEVVIKESNSGLLRSSIAAPTPESNAELSAATQQQQQKKKVILSEVSGDASPGQVLAMMGPSGSGKTSLLNCLSGRTPFDGGVLSVNGQPISGNAATGGSDMKRLMAKIAYVKQADIFFEHLTVRDQLGYTAFLRLPQGWPKQKKLDEVERIIKLLRLSKVADSKIQMLSGGEKKRVNIGTELLTDPSVLLLDEPTSGLDSTSAVALIRMLQDLARTQHKTVVTSIHQPSSALFASFDMLLMLAEGHAVYFGPPKESLTYLASLGMPCPSGYNAADHWMDLLVQDSAIDESMAIAMSTHSNDEENTNISNSDNGDVEAGKTAGRSYVTTRQRLIGAWDNDAVAAGIDANVTKEVIKRKSSFFSDSGKVSSKAKQFSKYNTGWGLQYRTLVHRSLKNSRSAIFTPINLIKSIALGLIAGLLWFQMAYTEATVFDRSSYFFFAMTFWIFDAMFQSFMAFPQERAVVLKERSSGAYRLSAYFMGKTTSEMPTRLVLPFIYMSISFWMASISTKFSVYVGTTLISLLSVMAGEAIGLLVGSTIYDMEKGMTAMTVISLFLALLGGFFVQNIPSFLEWAKFLSPFKYAFDASLPLVFQEPVPCDGSGALEGLCDESGEGFASSDDVIAFLGVQGSVGFNVGILIAIGLVPRYIAYLALRAKKEGDR
mmetsp:Transcript_44826/g.108777  ORF Transcript_44826/g.108777 Transcript_44826/m.108777 type:complete len:714 (+) Transcript_44826:123-2264(+)